MKDLSFSKPDISLINKIKQVVFELDVLKDESNQYVEGLVKLVTGNISEIIESIQPILLKDYKDNLEDASNNVYNYEYVLDINSYNYKALGVLTKLFSDSQDGSIFYGSIIIRECENKFSLWVDPDSVD